MIEYKEENNYCEHCGDLQPYTPTYSNGGASWCLDCARMDTVFRNTWNEEDITYFNKKCYKKRINYHVKQIVLLSNMLNNDIEEEK